MGGSSTRVLATHAHRPWDMCPTRYRLGSAWNRLRPMVLRVSDVEPSCNPFSSGHLGHVSVGFAAPLVVEKGCRFKISIGRGTIVDPIRKPAVCGGRGFFLNLVLDIIETARPRV